MSKLALIGCGNMGGAIVRGAAAAGKLDASQVTLFDTFLPAAQSLADALGGARIAPSVQEAVAAADVVIFAVKPHMLRDVMVSTAQELCAVNPVVVSIAAGVATSTIEGYADGFEKLRIVRVMPNINATIGKSVSALCGCGCTTEDDINTVRALFDAVGQTHLIDEHYFSVFAAIAGCSPAWTYTYINALAQAAVAHGLPKEQAVQIVAAAVEGSATMLLRESIEHHTVPQALVDRVCSPGGTTVAGLLAAEDAGFSPAARTAVDAAVARDKQLG